MIKGIAVFLALASTATVVAAETKDAFADTPGNRAAYQRSLAAYESMGREHGHFAQVNGIRMHYLEWGDASKVPFIWAHGYSSTAFEIAPVVDQLAQAGFHVISVGYRGHGETQVQDYNFSLANVADDVAALMDQLKLPCAVIGGLSLGGGVTTTFYENYPQRAMALVLEDGGADPIQERTERAYEAMKPSLAQYVQQMRPVDWRNADRFQAFRGLVEEFMGGGGSVLPDTTLIIFQSMLRQDSKDGLWGPHFDNQQLMGTIEDSLNPGAGYKLPLLHQSWRRIHPLITYRNLKVPMLIIDPTGDDIPPDGSFSPQYERLRALHPDLIEHVKYPDTGHAAHPQRPEWFVRDVTRLLQRVHQAGTDACLKPAKVHP